MNATRIRLLVWKEFRQLRRDPLLIRLVFLMPLLQLVLFGYVVSADVTHVPTAIVDLDHSPTSRALASRFEASEYFEVVARPTSEDALPRLLDTGEARVAIVIPEQTEAALTRGDVTPIGLVVDGSEATTASVGSAYAAQIVARFNADASGAAMASAPGIEARVRVFYNPTISTVVTMIPGLVAFIVMISLMVVMSQAVVRERESGTLEQMFTTPITRGEYLVGKIVPYVLLACAQAALIAVVGIAWFRVPFAGSLGAALVGFFLFLLTSVGLGLLVSIASHTRAQAQQTVMFIMIPSMVLCGLIFPIESMPDIVQPLCNVVPLTWALRVLRGTFVTGAGFAELWVPLLVLAGFAVAIFGAALTVVQRRLAE